MQNTSNTIWTTSGEVRYLKLVIDRDQISGFSNALTLKIGIYLDKSH